jgi:predicted nucleic acid-binding protein
MTKDRYVLDTNAVIYLTAQKSGPSGLLDAIKESYSFVSVITEIEALAKPGMPPQEESLLRAFLSRIPIIGLANDVKDEAIALRRATKLTLPDCLVAATAIALDAALLTADARLLNLVWPGYRARQVP